MFSLNHFKRYGKVWARSGYHDLVIFLGMKAEYPNLDDDFVSGDERTQIHATLLSMHVLWMREHNRIAEKLAEVLMPRLEKYGRKERDEILFQVPEIIF